MPTLTLNPLVPTQLGVTNPVQGDLFGFDGTGWRPVSRGFDVKLFGAKGDGVTDDTAAIQRAFTAAVAVQGTVVFPQPDVGQFYIVSDTITFGTVSGSANTVNVRTEGNPFANIQWRGGSGKSIFHCYNLKRSVWQGLKVRTQPSVAQSNLVGFDWDGASTGLNTMINMEFLDAGTGSGNTGWRWGSDASTNDVSFWNFDNCSVIGNANASSVGWDIRGGNVKEMIWLGGGTTFCNVGFKDNDAGTDWYWYGHGGTSTDNPFQLGGTGKFIYGGRWESGKRFFDWTATSTVGNFGVDGVTLANFAPADNIVFRLADPGRPVIGRISGLLAYGTDYTAAFFTLYNTQAAPGILHIDAAIRMASSVSPCTIVDNATGGFDLDWHVIRLNSANQPVGALPPPSVPRTLTYGPTVDTNAITMGPYKITVTNGTAFTIATPTNPVAGKTITYDIKNSSGGAHGVITWGAGFLNGGAGTVGTGAFAGIANGKRRTISFSYDGTNWIEQSRSADQ